MNDKIKKALKQFNREDLIDDGYERDLDSNIEVFLTIKQMIYYNQLQSNWNSLREWLFSEYLKKQHTEENNLIRIRLLLDKMTELEGEDNGTMD